MIVAIFIIPIVVAIFLLIFFRKEVTFWEYAVLIIPSVIISLLIQGCMKSFNANDTEYLGYYVTKISYYESWNEFVRRTKTVKVPAGKDSNGRTIYTTKEVDDSYVREHDERWTYTLNNDKECSISKKLFSEIKNKFRAPEIYRDMHRHYHTKDGDAYDYFWQGELKTCHTYTEEHSYENRLKSSKSILQYETVSKKEAKEYNLFDYPEIIADDQTPVLGINLPKEQIHYIKYLNSIYGRDKQIRLYLLFFKDGDIDLMTYQKGYWQGGNKNEVVICCGYDSLTNKVTWCDGFSWCDVPLIESKTKQYFLENPKIDLKKYAEFIEPYIKTDWKRKNFADFNYINIELSLTQYIWILIITLLYNFGASVWIVMNNYKNK